MEVSTKSKHHKSDIKQYRNYGAQIIDSFRENMKTINGYARVPGLYEIKLRILHVLEVQPLYTNDVLKHFGRIELYMGSISTALAKLKKEKLITSTKKIRDEAEYGPHTRLLHKITRLGKKYTKTSLMSDNSDTFLKMGIEEIAVLAAMQGNSAMCGSDFPKRPVIKGLKYPTGGPLKNLLYRMEAKGVVSSKLRPDMQKRGAFPPRYYFITKLGKKYIELSLMIGMI